VNTQQANISMECLYGVSAYCKQEWLMLQVVMAVMAVVAVMLLLNLLQWELEFVLELLIGHRIIPAGVVIPL
jgi:hypothetical protein